MKKIILLTLSIFPVLAIAQVKKKSYTDCSVCNVFAIHKGKKNHGQKYCSGYMDIRKYANGKIDTIGFDFGGQTWESNTYDLYMKLSERDKYIVDSLKEDGISHLQQSYLTYEPIYMKKGSKLQSFWDIGTGKVTILKYLIFNNKKGQGISLVSETKLN